MYHRLLTIDPQSQQSVLLLGPRGTGKTAYVKQRFPHALYIDLLHTETYNELLANPSRLVKYIPETFHGWIIIDEIQKIPALLNEVHRLIEHRQYRFVLTGSSARKLRSAGVNLLAGRALHYYMHPLIATEMGDDFSIERALRYGTLPKATSVDNPKHYLSTYVTTYLREEVLAEGLTRNLAEFTRFLECASFSQGSVVNVSELAREAAVKRHTAESYFNIVEDLLIGLRLPVFTKHAKRRLVGHPKFYFFDTGVYHCLHPKGPLDSREQLDGAGLETLLLTHLRAINDYYQLDYRIYYWRTTNNAEVDFVLYGELGLLAIEIKRKAKIQTGDLSGLKSFARDYPMAQLYLFYGGEREEYHGAVTVIPITQALYRLPELLHACKNQGNE